MYHFVPLCVTFKALHKNLFCGMMYACTHTYNQERHPKNESGIHFDFIPQTHMITTINYTISLVLLFSSFIPSCF